MSPLVKSQIYTIAFPLNIKAASMKQSEWGRVEWGISLINHKWKCYKGSLNRNHINNFKESHCIEAR